MSVEIEFPLEFVVLGTPVSFQAAGRRGSVDAWKTRVQEASRPHLPDGHFLSERRLSITLFYFPETTMQGDLDNLIKPVLDAMSRHIYLDDRQIDRILIQRFSADAIIEIVTSSALLRDVLNGPRPAFYIRLSGNLLEGAMP